MASDDVKRFKAQTGGGPPWDPETALCVLASDHDRVVAELRRQEELWRASFKDCARMVTDRDETIATLRAEVAEVKASVKWDAVVKQDERIGDLLKELEMAQRVWEKLTEQRNERCQVECIFPEETISKYDAEIAAIERKDGTK